MNLDDSVLDGSPVLFWTNKCHRNPRTLSPKTISCPAAFSTTTTTNLKRNKEMREKTTSCWMRRRTGHHYRTRKHIWPVEWTWIDMASRLLLIFCLLCPVIASPSAEPTIQQQQQGGLLPFPEGELVLHFLVFCLSLDTLLQTFYISWLSHYSKRPLCKKEYKKLWRVFG